MTDLTNIFKGNDEFLDEIIILPVGSHGAGTYNLPAGYTWLDFESVEFVGAYSAVPSSPRDALSLPKEVIQADPTSWAIEQAMSTSATTIQNSITAVSSTSFTLATTSSNLISVKAYKKRYGTRNLSKTVNVNGGANIASNSRYEIDIASELGTDYLDRVLKVTAEVYNNSGTGVADWGNPRFIFTGSVGKGVCADVLGSKIVVTSGAALGSTSNICGSSFGNTSEITSTTCRVTVQKVDQYLPTEIGSGGITEIITGSWGNGVTVDWSGTGKILSQFDMIHIEGYAGSVNDSTDKLPSKLFATTYATLVVEEGSYYATVSSVTDTSLLVSGLSGFITGIYGINYN